MGLKQSNISSEVTLKLLKKLGGLAEKMSQWEKEFCFDITHHLDSGGKPSTRQYAKLKSLEAKYYGS